MDSGINFEQVREGLIFFIILVCSLSLHEWGHAIVADMLGDDTPRSQGRVTTNPLAHIDPIGTLLFPLLGAFGFFGKLAMIGWAKPIYTNPSNFKRGRVDQAWVTLAGPGVNLFLALIAVIAAAVADLQRVVQGLLADSKDEISLDELAAAVGDLAVSTDEIDAMMSALEAKGRTVGTRSGKSGVTMLRAVVEAAREIAGERGKRPTHAEIAERSGLTVDEVRQALALARVMQR